MYKVTETASSMINIDIDHTARCLSHSRLSIYMYLSSDTAANLTVEYSLLLNIVAVVHEYRQQLNPTDKSDKNRCKLCDKICDKNWMFLNRLLCQCDLQLLSINRDLNVAMEGHKTSAGRPFDSIPGSCCRKETVLECIECINGPGWNMKLTSCSSVYE